MGPIDRIRHRLRRGARTRAAQRNLAIEVDVLRRAIGRIEERQVLASERAFDDSEFQVYSQFGEDGLLQWLLARVPVPRRYFVEFGVQNYVEANTRWLARGHGWSGLLLDGNRSDIDEIRQSKDYWAHDLTAVHAFVTAENIDALLHDHGAIGDIGVLSIDIDGNDYWVWQAITVVRPAVVVIEYNHRWGPDRSVTVPYDPAFVRRQAHWSHSYFGASLAALTALGEEKGYDLVGCGRDGVNAFFVRSELRPPSVPAQTPAVAFRASSVREATDESGSYTYATVEDELRTIEHLPLVEVRRPAE